MRQNLALRAHHLKRAARRIFVAHHGPYLEREKRRGESGHSRTESYTNFRTGAELGNAQHILMKSFGWARGGKPVKSEADFVKMVAGKVKEYPERDEPAENIKFSKSEMALAHEIGKKRLQAALEKLLLIDSITGKYFAIRAINAGDYPEHLFWHGGTHARRFL